MSARRRLRGWPAAELGADLVEQETHCLQVECLVACHVPECPSTQVVGDHRECRGGERVTVRLGSLGSAVYSLTRKRQHWEGALPRSKRPCRGRPPKFQRESARARTQVARLSPRLLPVGAYVPTDHRGSSLAPR